MDGNSAIGSLIWQGFFLRVEEEPSLGLGNQTLPAGGPNQIIVKGGRK